MARGVGSDMTSFVDVAIIGAGPYGLSVAAHLRGRGIDHRIFGEPMVASHSSAYGPLDRFEGREVTVLGAGSSALDLAALLHERGARVTLVARPERLQFHSSPYKKKSLRRRVMHYRPSSKIGGGWLLRL